MSADHDDRPSNPGRNPSFNDIIDQAVSRRTLIKSGIGVAALGFLSGIGLSSCGSDSDDDKKSSERMLGFKSVAASTGDRVIVPEGYVAEPFLPWGEPINETAPEWLSDASQDAEAQEQQIGDNHDGMTFFGFNAAGDGPGNRSDEGLLVINHEYINPEFFYAPGTGDGSDPGNWLLPFTLAKARKAQAAHGVSISHIRRTSSGTWTHVKASAYNRRITGRSSINIRGPAAGNDLMKTEADPDGVLARGTLNNCANGATPWGTYLTCEENFNGYFGATEAFTPNALQNRYGLKATSDYNWHTVDPRFDLSTNPNEANRFGWVVEINPFAPTARPIKRTALGRFKHENAELVIAPNGKVVVYLGDDERSEYIYKFVSDGTYSKGASVSSAGALLDSGTLYVAKFNAGTATMDSMGTGEWIPLVFGQNGLTEANGWVDQADILIRARQAADRVGATMMDRPEWIAANPKKKGEVLCTLTNNTNRGAVTPPINNNPDGTSVAGSARPAPDDANPRAINRWGQIIRWNEAGGNPAATTFTWDLFLIAGNPRVHTDARAGSANITPQNMFNSPDGLAFDSSGRLWIQSDGNFSNTGDFLDQGNNQMLAADPKTKEVRRFLVGPSGCEITGVTFTPDRKTMFVNVQHPGETGEHPRRPAVSTPDFMARNPGAFSNWPSNVPGDRPRAATVIVRRSDGGVIGESASAVVFADRAAPKSAN